MILLALLALAFLVSLLLGGRFEHLARLRLRHSYLILLALGIQVLVFSPIWQRWVGDSPWSSALYVLSLLLLIVVSVFNWRVPGVIPLASGLLLNALVILVNGGHMPASLQALKAAGIIGPEDSFDSLRVTNSSLIVEGTPLWFLGDIFAIPKEFPLANVFSVGDVLIGLGGVWFLLVNMRGPTAQVSFQGLSALAFLKRRHLLPELLLLGALLSLGLFAFRQYRLAARREFQAALAAHQAGDVRHAAQRYVRVMTLYRLTFSPFIATARANRVECELIQTADEARSQGRLADALAGYRAYLERYPEGLLSSQARVAIAETLYEWAEGLRRSGAYEAAIQKYQAVLEEYADAPIGGRAEVALAEAYAEWAAQLRRSGDYEQAIQTYWVLLVDYAGKLPRGGLLEAAAEAYREWLDDLAHSANGERGFEAYIQTLKAHLGSPTGAQAREALAEAYSRWALALREAGEHEAAIARYQLLLREYADTPAGQAAPAALDETHCQWAAQLEGWALAMVRAREYDQLIARCQAIVRDYPHTPTALGAAQILSDTYHLAFLARRNKRPCEALCILEAFAKAGQPLGSEAEALAPELLCGCGEEKRRKGLAAEAIALFERVIAEYPASPFAARAGAAIAEVKATQGVGARSTLEMTVKEHP